jgi:signal transduction histidine kinase
LPPDERPDLQSYLQAHLSNLGVLVALAPPEPPQFLQLQSRAIAPAIGSPKMFGSPLRPPLFVRLLAFEVHPVSVAFPGGTALLFADPARLRSTMVQLWTIVILFAALLMAIAWRIAIVVADNTLEPLLRTTRALNRFGDGDFTPEGVSTSDRTELGELARAYNRAVQQITRAFDERSRAEAEMRQFVADAGHQLRTPLTVIVGYLSAMSNRPETPRRAEAIHSMLIQSRRMKSLIDDLITLARLEHTVPNAAHAADVGEVLVRIPASFPQTVQPRIRIAPPDDSVWVRADEEDLLDAASALVDNALKYGRESPVDVAVRSGDPWCEIVVSDRGPGMNANDLRHAFDRFYRGSAGEGIAGTGLGLAIIRKSVERAGGTIELHNRDGGGLCATIRLTRVPNPSQQRAVPLLHAVHAHRDFSEPSGDAAAGAGDAADGGAATGNPRAS